MEEHYYLLEMDLQTSPGHMRVYGRGVPPGFIHFEHTDKFRIMRYRLEGFEYVGKDLTRHFLYFQRRYKKLLLLRKKAVSYLRRRELGLTYRSELSRYLE